MTEDQAMIATETEPTDPVPFHSMMEFMHAAARAGVGPGIRSAQPVQRSDESAAFVRMSLYPSALDLIARLLDEHAAVRAKQETGDLLRVLAGEGPE